METIFDTLNAKAALFAIDDLFEKEPKYKRVPVMISGRARGHACGVALSPRGPHDSARALVTLAIRRRARQAPSSTTAAARSPARRARPFLSRCRTPSRWPWA